jgi:hypothetical protein
MTPSSNHLVHTVYFSLDDHSASSCESFIEICRKYLADHPGALHFFIGPRNDSIQRNVSDLNYDVAMTIIFDTFHAYEAYHVSPRHDEFVEQLSRIPNSVRVFDSFLS